MTLPADLAEPLHILEPFRWGFLWPLPVLLLAWLWWRWRRRRRGAPERPARSAPRAAPPESGVLAAIRQARERFSAEGRFREGCHHLSELLRAHFSPRHDHPLTVLTAREIGARLGERPLSRLLDLLSELQFGRREPTGGDFEAVCDLAEAVSQGGTPKTRDGGRS